MEIIRYKSYINKCLIEKRRKGSEGREKSKHMIVCLTQEGVFQKPCLISIIREREEESVATKREAEVHPKIEKMRTQDSIERQEGVFKFST